MKQLEKNADTFGFFTQPLEQVKTTPFKKLAFLGCSFGIGITLALGIVNLSYNAYQNSEKKEEQQALKEIEKKQQAEDILAQSMKATNTRFLNQIKKINANDFQYFINYIEKQQTFYDSRAKLISNSLIQAQVEDREHSLDGLKASTAIELLIANHKETYDTTILNLYKTYKGAHENSIASTQSMQIFLDHYTSYEAGLAKRNLAIEKLFHSYVYAKNQGNVNYNLKHKISLQMQDLENENLSILKSAKMKF